MHGKLIYNDDLRQWHELKLDKNTCDWQSVEVVSKIIGLKQVHRYRGCSVTITGRLFFPSTGYYSAGLAIDADKIKPDKDCKPHPVEPDLSSVPIPKSLKDYTVTIQVDYRNRHIDVKVRPSAQNPILLTPWQAYASHYLTGSEDVIWFDCAKKFEVTTASQNPKQNHEIFPSVHGDNSTTFDGTGLNTLIFKCKRP